MFERLNWATRKLQFQFFSWLTGWMSRRPWQEPTTLRVMAKLAERTRVAYALEPARDLDALGAEWSRAFPNGGSVIVERQPDTLIGEIRGHCPLRGTGDTHACWRRMEYDRAMLGPLGGQLVVLDSQAEAGKSVCRVALRMAGQPNDDLVPPTCERPAARPLSQETLDDAHQSRLASRPAAGGPSFRARLSVVGRARG